MNLKLNENNKEDNRNNFLKNLQANVIDKEISLDHYNKFVNNKNNKGLYNVYSNVAHAYFKQTPINVFNLKVVNGNESFFRDEVKVTINEVEDDYFKNILKVYELLTLFSKVIL